MKYDNTEFKPASKDEIKLITKTLLRKIAKETPSFLFGYLEYKSNNMKLRTFYKIYYEHRFKKANYILKLYILTFYS